jgi:hypothetical protein
VIAGPLSSPRTHRSLLQHFYHFWGEVIIGAWRVYSTLGLGTTGVDQLPVMSRWVMPVSRALFLLIISLPLPFPISGGIMHHRILLPSFPPYLFIHSYPYSCHTHAHASTLTLTLILLLLFVDSDAEWRDKAALNGPLMRLAFPGARWSMRGGRRTGRGPG